MGEGGRDEEVASFLKNRIEDWSAKIYSLFITKMAAKRLKSYPIYDQKRLKNYTQFGAAHTCIAHIREYPSLPQDIH